MPKSPLSPNLPTFRGLLAGLHLFALIFSSTTLAKFWQNHHFCQIRQHFGALLAGLHLFALIIASTTLAKFSRNLHFCQIHRFCQIRQHFGALLAGLIYSLLTFRRQPWRNFANIATFAKFDVFANSPTFRGPSSWVNLFALIISSTTLAKFRKNRHFRHCLHFWTSVTRFSNSDD